MVVYAIGKDTIAGQNLADCLFKVFGDSEPECRRSTDKLSWLYQSVIKDKEGEILAYTGPTAEEIRSKKAKEVKLYLRAFMEVYAAREGIDFKDLVDMVKQKL